MSALGEATTRVMCARTADHNGEASPSQHLAQKLPQSFSLLSRVEEENKVSIEAESTSNGKHLLINLYSNDKYHYMNTICYCSFVLYINSPFGNVKYFLTGQN